MYDLQTGALQHTWLTPGSPQATCPQLVSHGEGYVLVITTAVEFMPAERRSGAPEAGSLFVAKTSFKAPAAAPAYRL